MRALSVVALLLALAAALPVQGAGATPVGTWRVIGDKSGKAEALVSISEHDGIYEGRIVAVLPRPDVDPDGRCELCPGARRNQPLCGLAILTGLRRQGGRYGGGEILDPDTGEIYRCELDVSEDNRELHVRGFIGIPLFGRTQTWIRE